MDTRVGMLYRNYAKTPRGKCLCTIILTLLIRSNTVLPKLHMQL